MVKQRTIKKIEKSQLDWYVHILWMGSNSSYNKNGNNANAEENIEQEISPENNIHGKQENFR